MALVSGRWGKARVNILVFCELVLENSAAPAYSLGGIGRLPPPTQSGSCQSCHLYIVRKVQPSVRSPTFVEFLLYTLFVTLRVLQCGPFRVFRRILREFSPHSAPVVLSICLLTVTKSVPHLLSDVAVCVSLRVSVLLCICRCLFPPFCSFSLCSFFSLYFFVQRDRVKLLKKST